MPSDTQVLGSLRCREAKTSFAKSDPCVMLIFGASGDFDQTAARPSDLQSGPLRRAASSDNFAVLEEQPSTP